MLKSHCSAWCQHIWLMHLYQKIIYAFLIEVEGATIVLALYMYSTLCLNFADWENLIHKVMQNEMCGINSFTIIQKMFLPGSIVSLKLFFYSIFIYLLHICYQALLSVTPCLNQNFKKSKRKACCIILPLVVWSGTNVHHNVTSRYHHHKAIQF